MYFSKVHAIPPRQERRDRSASHVADALRAALMNTQPRFAIQSGGRRVRGNLWVASKQTPTALSDHRICQIPPDERENR
ncbi:hypothetical protein [uncultured Sneathiella sp.]|uniref:hypothetical protein n=1 Tax=uncultured Sneathiella sp. TaxID=879315 RepID=UPI0030EE339C|tara:strand:- start:2521 stop:2757 length:237 start_codon:yes stop_codon:yes gene_type:complete